ncbi:MAG TPA: DUF802 domain-containing protein [Ideonella sp.]|uniref:DUF802 domain-containing protein n=1 Tax=Ideonella sp. TaxID=1929293 RepID=UPI002E331140|nr:DUF802 domain-containing protein [Ideonella sp.]HEX5683451.1 DUF802 domain-containing protein [Ideonella sp.]
MTRTLQLAAFLAGLATVGWVGAGYIGSNPVALAVTLLVAAFYLMGALELRRFHQATSTLSQALAQLSGPPPTLAPWLAVLHPSLQNTVRLRVEGERVALPGPALTPYLAGLLVLLGMLGTFLGMVVTLSGTGLALESATDLQAIRASLSAPVKGLGLAFGTSVAGVTASAALGLISALCRRERLLTAQLLDAKIATSLRVFSLAYQREESFKLLQQQAQLMPALVDRLQDMMATIDRQSQSLNERLATEQARFHHQAEAAYATLASSVDRSLQASLTESARAAGATIQPMVEATLAGIARETAALQTTVARTAQQQLDELADRFEASTAHTAQHWQTALAEHRQTTAALSQDLNASLDRFSATFERRSAALLEDVSTHLDNTVGSVSNTWQAALAQHERTSETLASQTQQALASAAGTFEQHSTTLLRTVDQAHAELQTRMAERDEQRLAAWTETLQAMAMALQQQWQQAGANTLSQQRQICQTLEQTAHDMSAQAETHAKNTIAEITRLVQAASEAPRAAAEVVAELRQQVSSSMERDNATLQERTRLLETLGALLDAVNHASTEQRAAIDALVGTSADLLERIGTRFTDKVDAETEKMATIAAQVTGSAVEVASLGEAFGFAVQLFSQSNDKLVAHLQHIEAALSKSIARSDEQLAYYVAQAREVIDLSIMSQQQIVEDLQQLAVKRVPADSEA